MEEEADDLRQDATDQGSDNENEQPETNSFPRPFPSRSSPWHACTPLPPGVMFV